MARPTRMNIMYVALLCITAFLAGYASCFAAVITSPNVSPGAATANSVYRFTIIYVDDPDYTPRLPVSIYLIVDGNYTVGEGMFVLDPGNSFIGTNLRTGVTYSICLSAGLDMVNTINGQFAYNDQIVHQYDKVYYCPLLNAKASNGEPELHHFRWELLYQAPADDQGVVPPPVPLVTNGTGPTVHDSFIYDPNPSVVEPHDVIRYGGTKNKILDWMYDFPEGYPTSLYSDPLHVEPYDPNVQFPDEGTSTSTYNFRVHYKNEEGLAPKPWVLWEPWCYESYLRFRSGVMLYLRNLDMPGDWYWGQYRGHFMYKEDPGGSDAGTVYVLRVLPTAPYIVRTGADHWRTTWAWTSVTNHYYEALPPGRYEYFFACSDDDFSELVEEAWPALDDDPPLPTAPAPGDRLYWQRGLNPSREDDGVTYGAYVDKVTYMPGAWMTRYPYDSWVGLSTMAPSFPNLEGHTIQYEAYTYPQVDPGLYQIGSDWGLNFARFLGTLSPFKRAVNPQIPNQGEFTWRLWAETAGATEQDVLTFRVNYWQSQGYQPNYVQLWINNSWRAEDGGWKTHPMQAVEGQPQPLDYRNGVTYEVALSGGQLGRGPHCYYFAAADEQWTDDRYAYGSIQVGSRVCRYPRRPETIQYDAATFYDGVLPGKSPAAGVDEGIPLENDIINGPYINTKPELMPNSWSVTPTVASSGTEFVYRVTYRDADNQRPYAPLLIIEYDDAENTFTASMVKAEHSDDDEAKGYPPVPEDNLTKPYSEGVIYEFRTSSAPGLKLEPGNRRFHFDFIDDWGRQTVPSDRIGGEQLDATQMGWIGGPVISSNSVPKLSQGSAESTDGTSNEATVWNYTVIYTDADNQEPAYIVLFIGCQDTPNGSIIWDSGHAMKPTNDADTVYSDGREYYHATRLPGNTTTPIKYYHCFVASDPIDPADYDATTSPSSGMVWGTEETLTSVGGSTTLFSFAHSPLVNDLPPSSELLTPTNYSGPVIYDNGVELSPSDYGLNAEDGELALNNPASGPITSKYWFGTEPGDLGPEAVTGNTPPVLLDGKVVPPNGQSTTQFVYSVIYKDLDGQAPQYINAVVDGVRHAMTPVYAGATTYKEGVAYQCTAYLTSGDHTYYFEASDGGSLVLFDADMSNTVVDPIPGPYINDRPTFSDALISPGGTIDMGQPVTYSITYTDNDNEAPNAGYPVVYIDNPDETDWNGTVSAVGTNFIKDLNQNWEPDTFNGMPVQVTLAGTQQRIVYKIDYNTETELFLVASDADIVTFGSQFTIGKLIMAKQDDADQIYTDGLVHEANVPSLGVGTHQAHFKAVVTETTMPGQTEDYTLRHPVTGEIASPVVSALAPPGNIGPTLTVGGVTPGTGTATTAFGFSVTYTDANGDSPLIAHGGTTGYMNLVIEESPGVWKLYKMAPLEDPPNYALGVHFTHTLSGLSLGPHQFHFEASDGWVSARLPESPTSEFTVYVSRPPTLTEGSVNPLSGNTGTVYEYKVKYSDPDNNPPASIKLVIDSGQPIEIGVPMPGADYIAGVVYSHPLSKGTLDESLHTYYFEATDGNGYAWYDQDVRDAEDAGQPDVAKNSTSSVPPSPIQPLDGPSVHSSTAPTLSEGTVLPATGFDMDTFTYSVTYEDIDDDEPEYVEVYIDGWDSADAYTMTRDPNDNDEFFVGVTYILEKTGLDPGSHTYFFKASDWLEEVVYPADGSGNPVPATGPIVSERATATITISAPSTVQVGDPVSVSGDVRGYSNQPLSVTLTLIITKPDGTPVSPAPTVNSGGTGHYQYTWTPDVTGTWKVQASWNGNNQYTTSTSIEQWILVAGPSTEVTGLDMISVPLAPISTFPDGVFGSSPPFALAKWLPSRIAYKLYSLLPGIRTDYDFPTIATGQGYWIKTLEPKTIAPRGTLVDSASYSVALGIGWNQVGSPYNWELSWGSLRVRYTVSGVSNEVSLATAAANGWVNDYGWTWLKDPSNPGSPGEYKLVDANRSGAERNMKPWRGYWVKSNTNCRLVIPGTRSAPASRDISGAGAAESTSVPSQPKWQVQIIASNGNLRDEYNYFGASRSEDEHLECPAYLENYVDLYFTDERGGVYATDLRADLSHGDTWQFNVATDKPGDIKLTWEGLESVPADVRLTLVDVAKDRFTEIVPGGSYTFRADEGGATRSFRILLEKK